LPQSIKCRLTRRSRGCNACARDEKKGDEKEEENIVTGRKMNKDIVIGRKMNMRREEEI